MSEKLDFTKSLDFLVQGLQETPQSPEQDVKQNYDDQLVVKDNVSFFDSLGKPEPQRDISRERIIEGIASQQRITDEFAGLAAASATPAPEQLVQDPRSFLGTDIEKTSRGFAAGWGDLLVGTGDTINFLKAWVSPGEPTPDTKFGNWLKGVGEQYQNDNVLVLSEKFENMTFSDLFTKEYFTSKFSRLLPYALSFIVPYGIGAKVAVRGTNALLGRFGKTALKGSRVAGKPGKFGVKGTGLTGKLLYDGGKKGVSLTKGGKEGLALFGGGIGANVAEGAYLAGESYNQMINDVDENGNPLYTADQAASYAKNVISKNLAWAGVDIISYGMLFGGLGRSFNIVKNLAASKPTKVKFGQGIKPFTVSLIKRAAPSLGVAAGYSAFEGTTEGFQEVYQEWAKYATEEKAKGNEYDSWTDWLKTAPTSQAPKEIKDIFWTSVGMGAVFGGARGYYDAEAERTLQLNEKIDQLNKNIDTWTQKYEDGEDIAGVQDNIIASQIWNYSGDGSGVRAKVQEQVNSGKMNQETADIFFEAITNIEKMYEKHSVNTGLTEAGAKQAFFYEVELARIRKEKQQILENQKDREQHFRDIYKNNESQLKENLDLLNEETNELLNIKNEEEQQLNQEIEAIYTRTKDKRRTAKSTGKKDKRFKQEGLSQEEFETFTQEGEQQRKEREAKEQQEAEAKAQQEKADRPSRTERVGEAIGRGITRISQVVQGIRQKRADKKDLKETIEQIDNLDNILPGAKEKLKQAVRDGKLTKEKALNIKGTGRNGQIRNKDVNNTIKEQERADKQQEDTSPETPEDVKKKDQRKVVPKTKDYKRVESAGSRTIPKAKIEKGRGLVYYTIVKDDETISYVDQAGVSDKFVQSDEDVNIELEVRKPQVGQDNVVDIDGDLFYQFGDQLYESEIIVKINGEQVGKVAQRDFQQTLKKRAKKSDPKNITKKVIDEIKERTKKIYDSFKPSTVLPTEEPNIDENFTRNFHRTNLYEYNLVKSIIDKKFPGYKGYLTSQQLIDSYGQRSVAFALGSSVIVNIDGARQSDIIHEAGHVYYGLMKDTPLMKRIRKVIYKSGIFKTTKLLYPELTLMNINGQKITVGEFYSQEKSSNKVLDSNVLTDIVNNLARAERKNDNNRMNELFTELRTQLKSLGHKEVRIDLQEPLIEESFTRALEAYSYGTSQTVIEGTKAQEQLRQDLIEFYKDIKNLTTEKEALELLNLSVDNIGDLDLEAAIKHVLLDFGSDRNTIPTVSNPARASMKKASNSRLKKVSGYSVVHASIGDYIGRNLTEDEIVRNVMNDLKKDHRLSDDELFKIKDYVRAIVIQTTKRNQLKIADQRLDKAINQIGLSTETIEDVSEDSENQNDLNAREEKDIALPTTLSAFTRKIVALFNYKNPAIPMDRKNLLHELVTISKSTKNEPFDFVMLLRKSTNHEIKSMLTVLDSVYQNPDVTNAKIIELKSPLDGLQIETLMNNTLIIDKEGKRTWKKYTATSSSVEDNALKSILDILQKDRTSKHDKIAKIYTNLFKVDPKDKVARREAAEEILGVLLDDSPKGLLIDKQALLNNPILFDDKQQYLEDIFFNFKEIGFTTKSGSRRKTIKLDNDKTWVVYKGKNEFSPTTDKFKPTGFFKYQVGKDLKGQKEIRQILTQGLVLSRSKNFLSIVDNVEKQGVSIFNKQNSLHNKSMRLAELVSKDYNFDSSNILSPENNIYTEILRNKLQKGLLLNEEGNILQNPFGIEINSGLMRYFISSKEGVEFEDMSLTLNALTSTELTASDFFNFIGVYNQKKNTEGFTYSQPIAVFSDKSRRYYVQSFAAHNTNMKNIILTKLKNNPAINAKYTKGQDIFPYTIVEKDGNLSIKEMPELVKQFSDYIKNNLELYEGNTQYNAIKNKREAYDAFLTSYLANKFMAQQVFIHDHRQSQSETDYIKRAAGAIASHTEFDKNVGVEPVIFKDLYVDDNLNITTEEENNYIENDAMGYMLPEQIEAVASKYGDIQKVGSVLKFVYYHTDIKSGETVYLKYAVHPLTPKMEQASPELKKIADVLRERHRMISENTIEDFKGDNIFKHGNLVMAVSESSTKVFKDGVSGPQGSKYVYDVNQDIDTINRLQNELYMQDGYTPLSGEGLGIQLELDKQSNERFFPSQLFYHLVTNIGVDEQALVNEMLQLRKEVMEANNIERNKALIKDEGATQDDVIKERDSFKTSMSPEVFGILVDSMFGFTDPRYPYLNSIYNSIAGGRIAHKGTKMYTKGSIAYQSSSLGLGLQSYKTPDDYFDDNGNFIADKFTNEQNKGDFESAILDLREENPNIIVSEAWVPEYLKAQGVNIGDIFIGTRIPAHGKVSSAVFIVKEFHDRLANTPSSNISIPAKVSSYWGADLDGDSVHMNFKWTDIETKVKNKSWRLKTNDFFDKYVQLVSKVEKKNELQSNIDFDEVSKKSIESVEKNTELSKIDIPTQLLPQGDAKMFEENVPSKRLVGIVAALQRVYNVFSNNNEQLPFNISFTNLQGETREVTQFFDDTTLENNTGNWYGVAQLLNIVLDNAKYQYAEKLGLNYQSIFPYVTLRRLGYSLEDISLIFNSPIVKKYMAFKKGQSKSYVSRNSDIEKMFGKEYDMSFNSLITFLQNEKLGKNLSSKTNWSKLSNRLKDGVNINIQDLLNNDRSANIDVVLMLYGLQQFNNDVVRPFGKAFTVHQSIEKNPLELKIIRDQIEEIINNEIIINPETVNIKTRKTKVGLNIPYTLGDSKSNPIVSHAMNLFDSFLNRASVTDIRYTPYMQSLLTTESAVQFLNDNKRAHLKSRIINQVIVNNLKKRMTLLYGARDPKTLIQELEDLQQLKPDNLFLNRILEIVEKKDGTKTLTYNTVEINELTSYKTINDIRKSFAKLSDQEKNLIFELEAEFNEFGFTGYPKAISFTPFFDQKYMESINNEIERIIQEDQNREYDEGSTVELELAEQMVVNPKDKYSVLEEIQKSSENDRFIVIEEDAFKGPKRKAKKYVGPNTSFNKDYLGDMDKEFTFNQWLADKGIRSEVIDKKSRTYQILKTRYSTYLNDFNIVKKFENTLSRKPLSSYTIKDLVDLANQFRKMDNTATKGISYLIEKSIGQKMFEKQSKFLQESAKKQNFKYVIPGEDGAQQKDISNFRTWLGANNMTSDRPELQELINQAEIEYTNYINRFNVYRKRIKEKNDALVKSKNKGLTVLERLSASLRPSEKYRMIYGNIIVEEDGKIRLLSEQEYATKRNNLTKEERDYYLEYRAITKIMFDAQRDSGMKSLETYVPGMQMGVLESYDKSGLFGLYNMIINSSDYDRVKVKGIDLDGKEKLKTFYEWKNEVYKGRTVAISLTTGRKINELEKLRRKAKKFKKIGRNEDGSLIQLSDVEYDTLINHGAILKRFMDEKPEGTTDLDLEIIQEYERRKGIKSELTTLDINTALLEFVRGSLFSNGDKKYDGTEADLQRFGGMNNLSILTDAAIAFNKNLDNVNAVKYLTGWWKEGFLGRGKQQSFVGKTGDKVIDGFVKLTSLRLLGFDISIGAGNLLAGKYQELRKRGGSQFVKGEIRYFKDRGKALDILKRYRVVQHSFDDFVHLSERKGLWGKIEKASFIFMDKTEHYIQGASFLGFLTDAEYNTGIIDEQRVRYINNKIATLHGEGYTALDASLLSMYSFGRAILQFKKWFITLINDRFGGEEINRFGEVNIGSYQASTRFAAQFVRRYFRGEISMNQFYDEFKSLSPAKQEEIKAHLRGLGIATVIIALISILDDEDEPDTVTLKYLKKLEKDIFVTTDDGRFINYTIIPSSIGTAKKAVKYVGEVTSLEKE